MYSQSNLFNGTFDSLNDFVQNDRIWPILCLVEVHSVVYTHIPHVLVSLPASQSVIYL